MTEVHLHLMLSAAIVGARGYLGRECVRLLLDHPKVDQVLPVSFSESGGQLGDTVPTFRHRDDLTLRGFEDPAVQEADVFFFATAGGQAAEHAARLPEEAVVIDLSRDHRVAALQAQASVLSTGEAVSAGAPGSGTWAFGLDETALQVPKGTTRIANPGCYPTSALLGLAPLMAAGLAARGPVVVDGKSGVSGAGATPHPQFHFTDTNDDVRAYRPVGHDHGEEMRLGVARLKGDEASRVRFTPHLIPINRGLLTTAYVPLEPGVDSDAVQAAYDTAYGDAETVRLTDEARIANVRGSVFADLAFTVDPECQMVVVRSTIDNLLKGGSGQAVQNMNRAFGFDATTGLPLIGGSP